jgi:hypothetical protein
MSKEKLATIDKRIRSRRYNVSDDNAALLQAELDKLPDLSDQFDRIEMAQPALANADEADDASDDAGASN